MTEEEWLDCADPAPMLRVVFGKARHRKLRLFAVACSQRIRHLVKDGQTLAALGVAERFADGLATDEERSAGRKAAAQAAQGRDVIQTPTSPKWERRAASSVYYATADDADKAAMAAGELAIESMIWLAGGHANCDSQAIKRTEQSQQAHLVRDVFGNPFRPVSVDPAWLTSTVLALARGVYEDRAFDRLPILADTLQDAGCEHPDLLGHLRSDGPHTRGCWALDLILGKE